MPCFSETERQRDLFLEAEENEASDWPGILAIDSDSTESVSDHGSTGNLNSSSGSTVLLESRYARQMETAYTLIGMTNISHFLQDPDSPQWLMFSEEEFANSPSSCDGISPEHERNFRHEQGVAIRKLAIDYINANRMSYLTLGTASVLMHRFYMVRSITDFNRAMVVLGVLVISIELQHHLSDQWLMRMAKQLLSMWPRDCCLDDTCGTPVAVEGSSELENLDKIWLQELRDQLDLETDDDTDNSNLREAVSEIEIEIFCALGFRTSVLLPHPFVVLIGQQLHGDETKIKELSVKAYSLATLTLETTAFCVMYPPTFVAHACFLLANQDFEMPLTLKTRPDCPWYKALDSTISLDEIQALVDIFKRCREELSLCSGQTKESDLVTIGRFHVTGSPPEETMSDENNNYDNINNNNLPNGTILSMQTISDSEQSPTSAQCHTPLEYSVSFCFNAAFCDIGIPFADSNAFPSFLREFSESTPSAQIWVHSQSLDPSPSPTPGAPFFKENLSLRGGSTSESDRDPFRPWTSQADEPPIQSSVASGDYRRQQEEVLSRGTDVELCGFNNTQNCNRPLTPQRQIADNESLSPPRGQLDHNNNHHQIQEIVQNKGICFKEPTSDGCTDVLNGPRHMSGEKNVFNDNSNLSERSGLSDTLPVSMSTLTVQNKRTNCHGQSWLDLLERKYNAIEHVHKTNFRTGIQNQLQRTTNEGKQDTVHPLASADQRSVFRFYQSVRPCPVPSATSQRPQTGSHFSATTSSNHDMSKLAKDSAQVNKLLALQSQQGHHRYGPTQKNAREERNVRTNQGQTNSLDAQFPRMPLMHDGLWTNQGQTNSLDAQFPRMLLMHDGIQEQVRLVQEQRRGSKLLSQEDYYQEKGLIASHPDQKNSIFTTNQGQNGQIEMISQSKPLMLTDTETTSQSVLNYLSVPQNPYPSNYATSHKCPMGQSQIVNFSQHFALIENAVIPRVAHTQMMHKDRNSRPLPHSGNLASGQDLPIDLSTKHQKSPLKVSDLESFTTSIDTKTGGVQQQPHFTMKFKVGDNMATSSFTTGSEVLQTSSDLRPIDILNSGSEESSPVIKKYQDTDRTSRALKDSKLITRDSQSKSVSHKHSNCREHIYSPKLVLTGQKKNSRADISSDHPPSQPKSPWRQDMTVSAGHIQQYQQHRQEHHQQQQQYAFQQKVGLAVTSISSLVPYDCYANINCSDDYNTSQNTPNASHPYNCKQSILKNETNTSGHAFTVPFSDNNNNLEKKIASTSSSYHSFAKTRNASPYTESPDFDHTRQYNGTETLSLLTSSSNNFKNHGYRPRSEGKVQEEKYVNDHRVHATENKLCHEFSMNYIWLSPSAPPETHKKIVTNYKTIPMIKEKLKESDKRNSNPTHSQLASPNVLNNHNSRHVPSQSILLAPQNYYNEMQRQGMGLYDQKNNRGLAVTPKYIFEKTTDSSSTMPRFSDCRAVSRDAIENKMDRLVSLPSNDNFTGLQCNVSFAGLRSNNSFSSLQSNDNVTSLQSNDNFAGLQFNDKFADLQSNDNFAGLQSNGTFVGLRSYDKFTGLKSNDNSAGLSPNVGSCSCENFVGPCSDENVAALQSETQFGGIHSKAQFPEQYPNAKCARLSANENLVVQHYHVKRSWTMSPLHQLVTQDMDALHPTGTVDKVSRSQGSSHPVFDSVLRVKSEPNGTNRDADVQVDPAPASYSRGDTGTVIGDASMGEKPSKSSVNEKLKTRWITREILSGEERERERATNYTMIPENMKRTFRDEPQMTLGVVKDANSNNFQTGVSERRKGNTYYADNPPKDRKNYTCKLLEENSDIEIDIASPFTHTTNDAFYGVCANLSRISKLHYDNKKSLQQSEEFYTDALTDTYYEEEHGALLCRSKSRQRSSESLNESDVSSNKPSNNVNDKVLCVNQSAKHDSTKNLRRSSKVTKRMVESKGDNNIPISLKRKSDVESDLKDASRPICSPNSHGKCLTNFMVVTDFDETIKYNSQERSRKTSQNDENLSSTDKTVTKSSERTAVDKCEIERPFHETNYTYECERSESNRKVALTKRKKTTKRNEIAKTNLNSSEAGKDVEIATMKSECQETTLGPGTSKKRGGLAKRKYSYTKHEINDENSNKKISKLRET